MSDEKAKAEAKVKAKAEEMDRKIKEKKLSPEDGELSDEALSRVAGGTKNFNSSKSNTSAVRPIDKDPTKDRTKDGLS